jgi:hypothetical protein
VCVILRDANLRLEHTIGVGDEERAWPDLRVADTPLLGVLAVALPKTTLHNPVLKYVKGNFGVVLYLHWRLALLLETIVGIHHVKVLYMMRIHIVLSYLQPITGHHRNGDVVVVLLSD